MINIHSNDNPFKISAYRPIYLWGGPGTIRMNRLKFLDIDVDEAAHLEVHTPEGADRVLNDLSCNWVHLMFNWGFPPEIEIEDWTSFERGAQVYHEHGLQVFAYIQTSNCVYDGSFMDKDWYALDPKGKKITYFAFEGRYMACLANPDWKQHLKDLIQGAIQRGADGIFFDNMFQGAMTVSMFDTFIGAVGCHCQICQQGYQHHTGQSIPKQINSGDPIIALYLRWRADQVTSLIRELAQFADQLQPGTPISGNDYNLMTANSYLLHGIDLEALAKVQDVTMIENFALPDWTDDPAPKLANNALNIRTARELVNGEAHLSMLAYDGAIGSDPVYPIRRYKQGIAEALACGTSTTTKGTEYYDGKKMTVLTASEYEHVRIAIGDYNRWLTDHASIFHETRRNLAPVGLLYPEQGLWIRWHQIAPIYFNAGQTLTIAGIPWRVVRLGDSMQGLATLFAFDQSDIQELGSNADARIVMVPEIDGWQPDKASLVSRKPFLRRMVSRSFLTGMNLYGKYKPIRRIADMFEVSKIVNRAFDNIPAKNIRNALLAALPEDINPRINSAEPCLIEIWERGHRVQVHLVNYSAKSQVVQVHFHDTVKVAAISPDVESTESYQGNPIRIPVDIYKILLLNKLK